MDVVAREESGSGLCHWQSLQGSGEGAPRPAFSRSAIGERRRSKAVNRCHAIIAALPPADHYQQQYRTRQGMEREMNRTAPASASSSQAEEFDGHPGVRLNYSSTVRPCLANHSPPPLKDKWRPRCQLPHGHRCCTHLTHTPPAIHRLRQTGPRLLHAPGCLAHVGTLHLTTACCSSPPAGKTSRAAARAWPDPSRNRLPSTASHWWNFVVTS